MPASSDCHGCENPSLPLHYPSPHLRHPDRARHFDYLHKYPADAQGKEIGGDSRTWKVYLDEHESHDYGMVKHFRNDIDVSLLFAALFSSVVTGFVVPAAERLEPDTALISTSILFEATQLLRANGNATLINATPRSELHPDSVTHTTADVFVAWMFFASLALSLAAALLSILAKQWLQAFTCLVPGDAKRRSLTRQFRFNGMQKWKFAEIVGFLPLLLHVSLLLFLVGLCVYVERFHWSFFTMVGFVSIAAAVFYVVTAALPAIYIDCPYRIPALFIPISAGQYVGKALRFIVVNDLWPFIRKFGQSFSVSSSCSQSVRRLPMWTSPEVSRPSFVSSPLTTQEREYVEQNTRSLEFSSLEWLYAQTTNVSVQRIVLHSSARVLANYGYCLLEGTESMSPPPSYLLEDMHSSALAIINNISGSELMADDIPQLLDFHLYAGHFLDRESKFSTSRWPSLIESPHLEAFTERNLLPLDVIFEVGNCTGHPLHIACYRDRWDFVERHLQDFPHFQWTKDDSEGWLPLGRAASSDKISIELWGDIVATTQCMISTSVGKLIINAYGDTVLHVLCEDGADLVKITSVEHILDGLWNLRREDGRTPLHILCAGRRNLSQRIEIAKYLLSKGADVGIVDFQGSTALHRAFLLDSPEIVETICSQLRTAENGRNIINQCDNDGMTALHLACCLGEARSQIAIQALILAGADPDIVDNEKNLALHLACCRDMKLRHIGILLDNMDTLRSINCQNARGETPLDVLVQGSERHGINLSKDQQDAYQLMRMKGAKRASELDQAE